MTTLDLEEIDRRFRAQLAHEARLRADGILIARAPGTRHQLDSYDSETPARILFLRPRTTEFHASEGRSA
jgi:hypothetical protein